MKAKIIYPLEALQGGLSKDYYCRMVHGKQVIQHRPRKQSERQKAMRKHFAQQWAGRPILILNSATECYGEGKP